MKDYYIGLDIGTSSIGWAVTDEAYKIVKQKGNAMWGVRLLDEGKTAAERRGFRTARRRIQRKKFRLQCLEMLFNQEVAKKDVAFFQRLKESSFYNGDKSVEGKYSLFQDAGYTDIQYHQEYPTIYHLRKKMVEGEIPQDVRLLYLAVSHLIKNRGHFLFDAEALSADGNADFHKIWEGLNTYLRDNFETELSCENPEEICSILKDGSLSASVKRNALIKLFGLKKKENAFEIAVLKLLAGETAKAVDLFNQEAYKDSEAKSVTFKNGYDVNAPVYETVFAEQFELIERLKAIYDWAVLADILQGEQYLSFSKVKAYEKHAGDLKLLKEYVRAYIPQKYNLIFNENKKGVSNYLSYSAHTSKGSVEQKCNQEAFCDFLKKELLREPPEGKYTQMFDEIAAGTFMPKCVTKDNAVIPMQINKAELQTILKNAQASFPFLCKEDETGHTVCDKILSIFNFRIPYYVGPLNPHSNKSWIVRTGEKIYPWNFEQVVDIDQSAERFIENLTSKCTYLPREDVIPKNSLLYSSFMVLNELNNLKLDGEPVPLTLKQSIYHDLFEKRNKVTQSALKKYLISKGYKAVQITGIDGDFKGSLKAWRDLAPFHLSTSDQEEIIREITILGADRNLLKKRLVTSYRDKLSQEDIRQICKLQYTGWSRLSRKFLTGVEAVLPQTGEVTNLMHALWETNDNLMQLLSSNYEFKTSIEIQNDAAAFTSLKEEVEALYVSPKVKRPIYQAMQIVEEIVKIQGCTPKKIFIEVAKGTDGKGRTVPRKQNLIDLYKNCKKEETALYEQLCQTEEGELRRDALYLYYTQMGRCMYTGESISIADLYDKNKYDIDHIFPRSKIKDDSLDNRVLVLKTVNDAKSNVYPIQPEIRQARLQYWKMLLDKNLITQKKFDRLVRNTPLTDEELSVFVARQLVETRQSTKAVAELLKKRYPTAAIEYVKSCYVSDFRQEYDLLKCREVNDLHHAKDAYLNIVVGNVYTVRARQAHFISDLQQGKCSLNEMFGFTVKGAWSTENKASLQTVKATMEKNNIRFTRYAFTKKGGLFDQNVLKKGKGQVPIKKNTPLHNIEKYGGYNGPAAAYFAFVEYTNEKGMVVRSFEAIDLYREPEYVADPQRFLAEKLQVEQVKVILPRIKYNALISIDGFRMHISCKSGGGRQLVCKPAMQLALGYPFEKYIKAISSYLAKCNILKKVKEVTQYDHLSPEENVALYDALLEKCCNTLLSVKFGKLGKTLSEKRDLFQALSVYEQCNVIIQVLNILHCNVLCGDLSLLGEAKNKGKLSISNKLTTDCHRCSIINQSITGLVEQEINLLA